jgi:hypothetical protein
MKTEGGFLKQLKDLKVVTPRPTEYIEAKKPLKVWRNSSFKRPLQYPGILGLCRAVVLVS